MRKIAKTGLTNELEKKLWHATNKIGVFGCFEVTIGFGGNERVDYLTYDTKGVWRCYEIKVSKEDFYSKSAKTFVGHHNYYVLPESLLSEVIDDIPKHIGIHNGSYCVRGARKQELGVSEDILKNSLIRSLYREQEKFYKTCDNNYINKLQGKINRLQNEARSNHNDAIRYRNLIYKLCAKYNLDHKEVRQLIRDS